MTLDVTILAALTFWFLSAVAAAGAASLREMSWHELEEFCRRRKHRRLFNQVRDEGDEVALSLEMLRVVGTVAFLGIAAYWWISHPENASLRQSQLLVAALVCILLLLISHLWIPRAVAAVCPASFTYYLWRVWRWIHLFMRPLAYGGAWTEALLRRLAGHEPASDREASEEAFEDEIRAIVSEGLREGHIEEGASEMIEGVIELDDADVAGIMTPRSKMDAIQIDAPWDEILRIVTESGRTRLPVYGKNLDDILGILYVKDLLRELREPVADRRPLRELLRESWFVPKTKRVDEILHVFLRDRLHLAIVVDEYMGTAGLVTIEDALEEIVGEIVDEAEEEEQLDIQPVGDHAADVRGEAPIEDINEQLGYELPEDDEFDTLAGFVMSLVGDIPKTGDELAWREYRMTILEADKRRVERVHIEMTNGDR